ncbi:hypothetical protein JTE90_029510 [Oedothorax gibbosus]|uniref:GATA-type domain-containing protein n=1 Tax=Oedothorax gibbosus TaxID=931172 RepID=A0AAV6UG50_9ARAC|nr:hypothetical protein JTE90_029510 [Oedothorax gibbosus]
MERCPVPWSETPPPSSIPAPSQLHHPPPTDDPHNHMDQATSDTEGPTPTTSRRGSLQPASRTPTPTSSVPPDAIQLAYSSAVENDAVGGMTVIRGMKSLSPDESGHSPVGGEQLVYQTLGDSNGFIGQYAAASGVGYSTGGFSPAPVDPPSPYDKYSYVKVGTYAQGDVHMVQGYDPDGSRPLSPSNVVYTTYQYPSQEVPSSNAHHPMWGPLGNAGSSPYLTGLGSPIMESGDPNGRGGQGYAPYIGNSTYLLASGNDNGWSTLPPMGSSSYMQEGRRTQYIDPPPEYSRIPEPPPQHQCAMCGTTDSTPWRRDSAGQFVCNTCGIYKNGVGSRASAIRPPRRLTTSRRVGMTCSNCSTTDTTLWRRNTQGEPVCNACGLYYKLHQVNRPISMRKDSIQTRKRKPKSTGSSKTKSSNSSSSNGRNGSSNKSPLSQPSSSSGIYHHQMAEGGRLSPLLPSSAALSQQLPHFAPLDPHSPPEHIVLEHGLMLETSSGPSSVISMAPNHKQL